MTCPECGKGPMTKVECPGWYPDPNQPDDPGTIPDWSCDFCGWGSFKTADKQKAEAEAVKMAHDQYEEDTGFRKYGAG